MHNDLNKALSRALAGVCLAAAAAAQAGSGNLAIMGATGIPAGAGAWTLSFGSDSPQRLNTVSAPQTISMKATSGAVTLYAVGTGSPDYRVVNSNCTSGLVLTAGTPRDRCAFAVEFEPRRPGVRYGEVAIETSATNSNAVYLYGNAEVSSAPLLDQVVTLTVPGPQEYRMGGTFEVRATSSAGLTPIRFGVPAASTGCSVASATLNTATINMLAPGACSIVAAQPGDSRHKPAMASASVVIGKGNQTVTFAPPASVTFVPNGTFAVSASTSAALTPVVVSSASTAICKAGGNNGWTITMIAAGTCALQASQSGNGFYNPASAAASVKLTALKEQTVNFAPASPITYRSGATFKLSATASSGLTVFTYSSSTPAVCTVSGAIVSIVQAGTCTLTAKQAGSSIYASASKTAQVVIQKASQTISFAPASPQPYAYGRTFTLSATSSAGLTHFSYASGSTSVCTVSGATATMRAVGTCVLTASEPGNANFNAAKATASVVISRQ